MKKRIIITVIRWQAVFLRKAEECLPENEVNTNEESYVQNTRRNAVSDDP